MRRFPAPWTVEAIAGGFKVSDSSGQALAYVYGHDDARDAATAKGLTLDEARRMAANIAKLPKLLDLVLSSHSSSLLAINSFALEPLQTVRSLNCLLELGLSLWHLAGLKKPEGGLSKVAEEAE